MSRRLPQTLVDYVVVAISPALIMALVGSLVFFLLEVFYQGEHLARLMFIFALFVMATVLIARISMEEGAGYAATFAVPLGIVTLLATFRFVEIRGALAGIGWIINIGIIGLIWWCAHKLTWDCTLIDETQDASGEGLLQTVGLDRRGDEGGSGSSGNEPIIEGVTGAEEVKGWWNELVEQSKRPHAPGVWVVYFSLAALPLFGIGQWFIHAQNVASRQHSFMLLCVYVASGLALLMTTSLLGLRRYLRQRKLQMPVQMAALWMTVGCGLILGLLAFCAFLPRPGAEYAAARLPVWASSPTGLRSSRHAMGSDAPENEPPGSSGATRDGEQSDSQAAGGDQHPSPSGERQGVQGRQSDQASGQQQSQNGDQQGVQGQRSEQSGGRQNAARNQSQQQDGQSSGSQTSQSSGNQASQQNGNSRQGSQSSESSGESSGSQQQNSRSGSSDQQSSSNGEGSRENSSGQGRQEQTGQSGDNTSSRSDSQNARSDARAEPPNSQGDSENGAPQPGRDSERANSASRQNETPGNQGSAGENSSQSGPRFNRDGDSQSASQRNEDSNRRDDPDSASSRSRQGNQSSPLQFDQLAGNLGGVLANLLKLAFYSALVLFALYLLWRYHKEIMQALSKFLVELGDFWNRLFGGRQDKQEAGGEATASATPPRPFASYSDPFLTGAAARLSPEELLTYSFQALEAWGREKGSPRGADQTPHEFAQRIQAEFIALHPTALNLAELYCRAAYGGQSPTRGSLDVLRQFWSQLRSAEPPLAIAQTASGAH